MTDGGHRHHHGLAQRMVRIVRGRARTFFAFLMMAATWPATGWLPWGDALSVPARLLVSWNVGALLWLVLAVVMMMRSDAARMRRRAAQQDDGAAIILLVSCIAASACLVAIASVLGNAPHLPAAPRSWHIGLGVLTIFSAWTFMHVAFTLHYAHAWYEPDGEGLLFPDHEKSPDYFDFAYFALTIGVACQTSDVCVAGRRMRRLVTGHSVLAFFFNTAVLALGVNVAASVVGGG